MIKILFVCHGNICRSPMAEFVMKDIVKKAGLRDFFLIESAATSAEEIGNGVYPPAKRKLAEHGIACDGKRARQLCCDDYDRYDYLIAMDRANYHHMCTLLGRSEKVRLLLSYAGRNDEVADPWYTGDFEATWQDVSTGCAALLETILAVQKGRIY